MRAFWFILANVLFLSATCHRPKTRGVEQEPAAPVLSTPPEAAPRGQSRYGQPITGGEPVPVAAILAAPDRYQDKTVVVEGTVRAACQAKGCWLELAASAAHDAPGCRVTFKDYGFFVPRDSVGAHARVQAEVKLTTVPRTRVAHWESEGAHFPDKRPDGSAREVRLVATGVELHRRPPTGAP